MRLRRCLILGPLLLLAACASTPRGEQPARASMAPDPRCLQETGTRIEGHCVPGQTVQRDELDATGASNLAEALATRLPALRRR